MGLDIKGLWAEIRRYIYNSQGRGLRNYRAVGQKKVYEGSVEYILKKCGVCGSVWGLNLSKNVVFGASEGKSLKTVGFFEAVGATSLKTKGLWDFLGFEV